MKIGYIKVSDLATAINTLTRPKITWRDDRLTLEEIGAGCYAFVDATSSDPVSEYFDSILSACRWADENGVDYEISKDILPAYRAAIG